MIFLPKHTLETGTVFILFCESGYLPEVTYGYMNCGKQGYWLNSPTCTKAPILTTTKPIPIYPCTASLTIDDSASTLFIPVNDIKTGTTFVVFCKYGYGPKMAFGTMKCSKEGLWENAPVCSRSSMYETTTKKLYPSRIQTTQLIDHETTTREFVASEQDEGKHPFVPKCTKFSSNTHCTHFGYCTW